MNNCIKGGRVPTVAEFDVKALVKSISDYSLSVQVGETNDDAQTPKNFSYDDWTACQQ